jgi:hypothetical protein
VSGPKAGVYLDAAMAVVEQEVNERIDRIQDRRRRLSRMVVGALLVGTVAGGAATAAALTAAPPKTTSAVSERVVVELHCIDGADAGGTAYFTVRYRVAAPDASSIAATGVCSAAHAALTDSIELARAEPAELLEIASLIVGAAAASGQEVDYTVDEASFGSAALPATAVSYGACERESDGRIAVLTLPVDSAPQTPAGWASRCMMTDGYGLAGGE